MEELTKLIDNNDPRFVSNDVYFFDDLGKAIKRKRQDGTEFWSARG